MALPSSAWRAAFPERDDGRILAEPAPRHRVSHVLRRRHAPRGGRRAVAPAEPRVCQGVSHSQERGAFDAAFFGYSPKEAAIMDPQHRIFLEICWEAFEDAGYDPARTRRSLASSPARQCAVELPDGDYDHPEMRGRRRACNTSTTTTTSSPRASAQAELTGPSLTVQTACSTSLVAVHLACQSLMSGGCDWPGRSFDRARPSHSRLSGGARQRPFTRRALQGVRRRGRRDNLRQRCGRCPAEAGRRRTRRRRSHLRRHQRQRGDE